MSSDEQSKTAPSERVAHQPGEEGITAASPEEKIAKQLADADFQEWYKGYRFAENIRNGQSYFNGPSKLKPPANLNPSDLLKCHRKTYYSHLNAPEETDDPEGIFYFGSKFEEDLAEQFIADVVTVPQTYLQNSIWVRSEIDTEIGTVELSGSTDPVIVDENAEPHILTEIKTSTSLKYTNEPKDHHLAQAHAYMLGLSKKFETDINDTVFLYADRESLDAKTFHVSFDQEFWETEVVDWVRRYTYYRVFGFLPPADPVQEWECEFCPYKNRCGEVSEFYEDEEAAGFLPLYTAYPRNKVVEYLESHEAAKLTPALAHKFPGLAKEYHVFDWECSKCEANFSWDEIEYDLNKTPTCPACESKEDRGFLSGPDPEEQHYIEVVEPTSAE